MAREYIPIFFDWLETTQDLTQEQKGNLIDAAVLYASGGDFESALTGVEVIAFRFIKGQIDRNNAISDARSRAGSNKKEQNESNGNKQEQNGSNSPKEKENNKDNKKENDNRFDRFWAAYPKKVAKPEARKRFEKISPDEETLALMLAAIERAKQSEQWAKDGGQFIPHPATWLNRRQWEDETEPVRPIGGYEQRDYREVQEEMMRAQNERVLKRLNANNFEQRDYSAVPDQMIRELGEEVAAFMKGAG